MEETKTTNGTVNEGEAVTPEQSEPEAPKVVSKKEMIEVPKGVATGYRFIKKYVVPACLAGASVFLGYNIGKRKASAKVVEDLGPQLKLEQKPTINVPSVAETVNTFDTVE